VRDFNAMNSLAEKYGDKVNILAFPCNQFGHQTNEGDAEFVNTLKYVRPGNNFELAPSISLFTKGDVNGLDAWPLWKYLKSEIMVPSGPKGDTKENGCDDIDALILPRGGFGGTTISLWTPVCRSDVAWNFEKFLVGPDGAVVKRYSRYFDMTDSAELYADIDALM